MAFEPLMAVADRGTPIYLVPGNHERSAIPHRHLAQHPEIHIFDRPQTYLLNKNEFTLSLAGFPFVRHGIRRDFLHRLDQTGWKNSKADVRVLCIHQAVDGATVGPVGYMFRYATDVIRASDIPAEFSAALSGHIHRFQILSKSIRGKALNAPVFYPGSIERTSFAERFEKKGYLILEFETDGLKAGALKQWTFHELPLRPMVQLVVNAAGMTDIEIKAWIRTRMETLPEDSIVKLKIHGKISRNAETVMRAETLRSLVPPTMNINASFMG
jgi:DNA repair exonuclease SbcCD nuclease subunit